jgi:hypothetical protein
MALEALDWAAEPDFTNLDDGAQSYNMGIRFTVPVEIECPGVEWRVPDGTLLAPSGGVYKVSIWDEGPTRLADAAFTPVPGGYQQVMFAAPITLAPGTNYIAAVYTRTYVFRASGGVYPSTPSGSAVADAGRLIAYNGGPDDPISSAPSGSSTGIFYVSPIVGTAGDDHDTAGTAGLTVAGSATSGASKPSTGAAGLTVAATATRSTSRLTAATAGLTATATAVGTTSRLTTGRAELAAGASAARTTARTTAGTARVLFDAYGTQVRGGGGPRLVTVSRASRLTSVARPGAITTSTRG